MIITLRRVGHSTGCTFPKSLLDHLGLGPGDRVEATEKEGKIELAPVKKIVPIKLGGLWKGMPPIDIEDIRKIRREMWKSFGEEQA